MTAQKRATFDVPREGGGDRGPRREREDRPERNDGPEPEFAFYYAESGTSGSGLFCTASTSVPSTKFDFETVFLHELGHNVGFRHRERPTTCVMYEYRSKGAVVRRPCSDEAAAYRAIYGNR